MSKPTTDRNDLLRCGNEFWGACNANRAKLEERCEPGAIDQLKTDLELLAAKNVAAVNTRIEKKALTLGQGQALAQGAELVSHMRNLIRRRHPKNLELQKTYGVGEKIVPGSVDSVGAALKKASEAAEADPVAARAAGILPEDLEVLSTTLSALTSKDQTQEEKKVSSKQATAERDETHLRVERRIFALYAIAQYVFRNEPEILARFTNALPPTRSARARAKKKAAADTSSTPSTPTTPA